MVRIAPALAFAFVSSALTAPLYAIDPARDFSGKWVLDARGSNTQALPAQPEQTLTVAQQDVAIACTATSSNGATAQWSYLLDGTETRFRRGDEARSSVARWEGSTLLIETRVGEPQNYTIKDRWQLSRDRSVLTITRQVDRKRGQVEGMLVYSREAPPLNAEPSQPAFVKQPGQPAGGDLTVLSGTRIALSLRNGLDTKHTHEGDRVYLETIEPIAVNGRIVIPRGSYVDGTVTESKPAHGVKGKGEMYIRFDSLLLPNGVSRDFHSRLTSADSSARGTVDASEGKVTGERDGSGDARTVAMGGGMGAGVGGIAGGAAGHPLGGVGIGAGVGVGAGLATILHDKRPQAVLPRGTIVEMTLDRDLSFDPNELW